MNVFIEGLTYQKPQLDHATTEHLWLVCLRGGCESRSSWVGIDLLDGTDGLLLVGEVKLLCGGFACVCHGVDCM